MNRRYIPNILSCLRLALLVPVVWTLLAKHYELAFYFFIAAGLSDGIDGFLARRYDWKTHFGAFIDPLADKVLLIFTFFTLAWLNQIPLWLVIMMISRDLIIMAGVLGLYVRYGKVDFVPTMISKITTVSQVSFAFLLLFNLAYTTLPHVLYVSLMVIVICSTLWSLIDYVWVWSWYAYRHKPPRFTQ